MSDTPTVQIPSPRTGRGGDVLGRIKGLEQLVPSVERVKESVATIGDEVRLFVEEKNDEMKRMEEKLEAKELTCASLSKDLQETKMIIAKLGTDDKLRAILQENACESLLSSMDQHSMADSSYLSTSLESSVYSTLQSSVISRPLHSTPMQRAPPAAIKSDDVKFLQEEISRLQEHLRTVIDVNKKWKEDYEKMEATKNSKIDELKAQLGQIEESQHTSDDVRRAIIAAEAKASMVERERDEARREVQALRAQFANVKLELEGSRHQLNSVLDRHEQEERTNTENIERLKQRMRDAVAARRQADVELRSALSEVEALQRQNRSYESQLSHLRRGLHSLMFQEDATPGSKQQRETTGKRAQKSTGGIYVKGSAGLVPRGKSGKGVTLESSPVELPSNVTIDERRKTDSSH